MNNNTSALVLFSGGQDSATCLAWALENYDRVETIGFDYGQRHKVELEQRVIVLEQFKNDFPNWRQRLGNDLVLDLGILGQISDCALTKDTAFEYQENGLPNSFVPARNLLFFNLAAAIGYRRGIFDLVGGMCETDYSGYPDCRRDTLDATAKSLSLGMDKEFHIITPLMYVDKARTWAMANDLGGITLIEIMKEHTHTCYNGDRTNRHDWGYGCGTCPACELRANGYEQWLG